MFTSKSSSRRRSVPAFLENLEQRRMLSVAVNNQTLLITGEQAANEIRILKVDANVSVSVNGTAQPITQAFKNVEINGGSGNDNIRVLLPRTLVGSLKINGGGGNDTINVGISNMAVDADGNNLTETQANQNKAPINVEINGGAGNDDITFAMGVQSVFGSVSAANNASSSTNAYRDVNVAINGGDGNDTISATLTLVAPGELFQLIGTNPQAPKPLYLGSFNISVEGGAGNDTIGVTLRSPENVAVRNSNTQNNNDDDDDDDNEHGNHHGNNGNHYGWFKNHKKHDRNDDDGEDDNTTRNYLVRIRGGAGDDTITLNVDGGFEGAGVHRLFFIGGGRGDDSSHTNLADSAVVIRNVEDELGL